MNIFVQIDRRDTYCRNSHYRDTCKLMDTVPGYYICRAFRKVLDDGFMGEVKRCSECLQSEDNMKPKQELCDDH